MNRREQHRVTILILEASLRAHSLNGRFTSNATTQRVQITAAG